MSERVPPDPAGIRRAADALRRGGLVAFPTETVYGLGADATSDLAVARIFEAKRRPRFNPLIVHLADAAEAPRLARWPKLGARLAAAFWPGALTLVVESRPGVALSPLVSAGAPTVALRVPAHPVAARLLAAVGRPVAAPSANPAGRISPTTADHVAAGLGDAVDLILDGGTCPLGLESTVVDLTVQPPALLRPGGLPRDALEAITGPLGRPDGQAGVARAPGMLASHYAPRLPVRLDALTVGPDEALLAFGSPVPEGARVVRNLSPGADLVEAAANLFAMLHELDRSGAAGIAVMPIPSHGLGEAILDRLERAAAPRA
ncbi:MAG TPA: L-threonylcarbamoyladenylate synthase [Geminicoccaceae bacterium]